MLTLEHPTQPPFTDKDPRNALITTCLRKYRRIDPIEERNLKIRGPESFRPVLTIIRSLGKKSKKGNPNQQKFKIGNGKNRVSKILAQNLRSKKRHCPIILVPNEVLSGNLNYFNAKNFLVGKQYKEVSKGEEAGRDSRRKHVSFTKRMAGADVDFEIWDDIRVVRQRGRVQDVVAVFIKVSHFLFFCF